MRRRLLLLGLALLLPGLVSAQCPGITTQLTAFATEQLTVGGSAISLTASIYKPPGVTPAMAVVSVQGGTINYLEVGTPSATAGHPVPGGATFPICGFDSIAAFKAIRVGADAQLRATYYKLK
jgi:hypothetical protein